MLIGYMRTEVYVMAFKFKIGKLSNVKIQYGAKI